jgi:ribosomal protein L18E
LDYEFSIDEVIVLNKLAVIMDEMISESKLPIWKDLKERLQESISNTKPPINISKGLEDFIDKLNIKGIIGFAKINGEIVIQLKKRMTEVGIFDDN